ncbi:MAG: pectinesterase family protein [Candidatus Coproplasma sp.]
MNYLTVSENDDLQNILSKITQPTTIYMKKGTYRQKIVIDKDDVKLVGEERETTIITYDDYAKKIHSDGGEYNTFRTFTVCVTGERVVIENLTIVNSNTAPEKVGQCVALSVNAKVFKAVNVDLRSTQDTLFTAPFPDDLVIRYSGLTDDPAYYDGFIPKSQLYMEGTSVQLYEKCRIYGNVDFIFGGAEAYFKDCELISIAEKRVFGYVSAPCHSLKQVTGYVFLDCVFKSEGAGNSTVYLARPWRDFGKCDFVNCKLDSHISPLLFDKWNDTYRNKTARFGYYNLSGATLSPVEWGKELTREQADNIIYRFNEIKKEYFGE